MEDDGCAVAVLAFLEATSVGRKAGEKEWEEGRDGSASEEEDESVEVERELVVVEDGGDGVLESSLIGPVGEQGEPYR